MSVTLQARARQPKPEGKQRANLPIEAILTELWIFNAAVFHTLRPVTASDAECHCSCVLRKGRTMRRANTLLPWQMLSQIVATCACSPMLGLHASTSVRRAHDRLCALAAARLQLPCQVKPAKCAVLTTERCSQHYERQHDGSVGSECGSSTAKV